MAGSSSNGTDGVTTTQNPSIIIDKQFVPVTLHIGEMPGSPEEDIPDDLMFGGGMVRRPIHPRVALRAVMKNGSLAATCHAVGEGTAGLGYDITPRFRGDVNDRTTWPKGAAEQKDLLDIFLQAAFVGDRMESLREGFYRQEHDRVILGWGGVIVHRQSPEDMVAGLMTGRVNGDLPRPTKWLSRFEAAGAEFTKPSRRTTMMPVPIALEDGRIVWIEVPRNFRRIKFTSGGGRVMWFKEFGDWRNMDARTGKYSSGARRTPPTRPFQPGRYTPGALPKDAIPAVEVMHWATPFPGVSPYGLSGWHSELKAINASDEHIQLLLAYLKSGLHSVIIAAANRKFDSATADAAIQKIDELGRGREGLGSLVTIELIPADSAIQGSGGNVFQEGASGDRGRLVLHELTTKLPSELLDRTMNEALSTRVSEAERIPALLLGRSDSYNFATASAAWTVVNRLRFMPHFKGREAFLDNFLIQAGIIHWRLLVKSPDWDEKEPLSGVAQVSGSFGGVTINRAMQILNEVIDAEFDPVRAWWGNIPLKFVELVMASPDPQATLDALDLPDKPQIPGAEGLKAAPPPPPPVDDDEDEPPSLDQEEQEG